ncbi:MAG: efflux RND transporter periplasmic adaptor subunit [Planctomycetota bacterium]
MRWLILPLLGVLGLGGWYAYGRWVAPADPITYREAEVQRGTIVSTVSATGTVQPLVKVLVGSQVSGTVVRWYADFNASVTKDFVLAELDQDRFKAQVEQRKAAVAVAKARVEENAARVTTAKLERDRVERAMERSAASEYEVEARRADELAATAALHAAQAQLEAAEADLRLVQVELDRTIIRSPIDGVVISRDVDAGQTVAASLSAPTLFTIANDLTRMQVNAAVSETDIGDIHEGMQAEFRVDAYPDRKFAGTVAQVRYAETVVDNVVTYTTLINVDNPDLLLRPGMTATIMFEVAKAENVLMVPNAALRFTPQAAPEPVDPRRPGRGRPLQPRVFRLAGHDLVEIPLELGLNDGKFTELRRGELKEGDHLVVEQQFRNVRAPSQRMPRM